MSDLTIMVLLLTLIFAFTIVLLIVCRKTPQYLVFNDRISIKDFMYPAEIPNYAIESIDLVEKLPKIVMRTNGYGGIETWKGLFRIEGIRRAVLYTENHNRGPFIKIQSTSDVVYINMKDADMTRQLFDEMKNNVKLLKETDLIECKVVNVKRSWIIVGVFTAIVLLVSIIPVFFNNG